MKLTKTIDLMEEAIAALLNAQNTLKPKVHFQSSRKS